MKKKILVIFLLLFISSAYSLSVNLTVAPDGGNAPVTSTLTATVSGGNPKYIFEWDFTGDGTIDAATNSPENSITFTYQAGNHNPIVKVTDATNLKAEDTKKVNISEAGNFFPTAHPGGPYTKEPGENIILDGSLSSDHDGPINSYTWSITTTKGTPDCPATATGVNPTIICTGIGEAEAILTVTDKKGATDSKAIVLKIREVQHDDVINIIGIEIKPEILKDGDAFKVTVTIRNETNTPQPYELCYEMKKDRPDMKNSPDLLNLGACILPGVVAPFSQKKSDELIFAGGWLQTLITPGENYWVYVTAKATAEVENDESFNSRREIFSYKKTPEEMQLPETNFIGIIFAVFAVLVILKR